MKTRIGSTKQKYRLYADGTIVDQETGKTVGFVWGVDLDYVWNLPAASKQKWLKNRVEK